MTPEQFVIWLRGFTEGVHEFNVSPKQWDYLKEVLAEVKNEDKITIREPIPTYSGYTPGATATPNTSITTKKPVAYTLTTAGEGTAVYRTKNLLTDSVHNLHSQIIKEDGKLQ